MEKIRVWEVGEHDSFQEIVEGKLDLEKRIEGWLEQDISIIGDFLVIGRQVRTAYNGIIDLLCIDCDGNIAIVELKRDKTPRDITSQVLDYGSWVQELSADDVADIANQYFLSKNVTFEEAFIEQFDIPFPEALNQSHKFAIVASQIDESTERIIRYLVDTYSVNINAFTFQYFRTRDGRELIANTSLIDPDELEEIEQTSAITGKKGSNIYEHLLQLAEFRGVRDIYAYLIEKSSLFFNRSNYPAHDAFVFKKNLRWMFAIYPNSSSSTKGLHCWFQTPNLATYLETEEERIVEILPDNAVSSGVNTRYQGHTVYFQSQKDIDLFVEKLKILTPNLQLN